jgi:hypothetical protein
MEKKYIGASLVLVQDGDRLIVRVHLALHVAGVALMLVLGSALVLFACTGLWLDMRAGALLLSGLIGVFCLAVGVTLLVTGETPCILDRQSGTMQGRGLLLRKVVCPLKEVKTDVEEYQRLTAHNTTVVTRYRVRLHPEVVVCGFSSEKAAEALASEVREWLKKARRDWLRKGRRDWL